MTALAWLDSLPKRVLLLLGAAAVCVIAYLDWRTGYEINLFVFYAIPIGIVVWLSDRFFGIVLAALSTIAWFVVYARTGHHYSSTWIGYWDAGVRGVFFLFVAFACPAIKLKMEKDRHEARVLRGLLPICNSCKRIQDDAGAWVDVETYVCEHSDAEFSQKLCPNCSRKVYAKEFAP